MLRYAENLVPVQRQDEKRGWLCILGVCLVFIFNVSLIPTFGILFEPYFEGDNESAAIVTNLFQFLSNLTILVTGFMIKDLSARNFVLIGTSITFLGLMLSSAVKSLVQLIFTYSIGIGIGLGLLNPACFVAALSCFTFKRVFAISLGFGALGFGQLVMPMFTKELLAIYGIRPTLVIIGILSLIGHIGGHMLVPIKWKPCAPRDLETHPLIIRKSLGKSSALMTIVEATDLDLLWNNGYIIIILGLSFVYASSTNLNLILPVYLQKVTIFDPVFINQCIVTVSVSDIITRISYPLLSTGFKLPNRFWFIVGVAGLTGVRLMLLFMNLEDYHVLLVICAALGFFRALTVVNQVLVLLDFCEEFCPTKLPGLLGLSVVIKTMMLVIFGWLFSFLQRVSPDLTFSLYSHILLLTLIIFIWMVAR